MLMSVPVSLRMTPGPARRPLICAGSVIAPPNSTRESPEPMAIALLAPTRPLS